LQVPYILGPVGGGESAPKIFRKTLGVRGRIYEYLRNLSRLRGQLDPFVRMTLRRAGAVFATTQMTADDLRAMDYKREIRILSQAAIPDRDLQRLTSLPEKANTPFRVFGMGRLLHWKGFHLALSAFAKFHMRFPQSEFWLMGDGPERPRLKEQARCLGIDSCVSFLGELSRDKAFERIGECDVMLQPSLHDSSSWASAEAMAGGRPVVCLDLGGLSLQVDKNTGVKIPAKDPDQAVNDMAEALEVLARDPVLRLRMGKAAREKALREFRWKKKVSQISSLYHSLASRRREHSKAVISELSETELKR
jgi:glycosyltransferase involved in cell wall biosynthesis